MKTSLRKLRGFALNRHGGGGDFKDRRDPRPLARFDELAKASQDMQDMRDCYDSLLSAAAATANSAYEFSESLREMGACLLEKTALNDDEESGKVLLMIGKVQYELQKLVDDYRSHIFQTITVPSESLLNELRIVEEMKCQCDEKRETYEYMVTQYKEKGRGRSGKGDGLSMQQLQAAHDEYDEEATLFVFRLKSLKQGQSHSLLTQAARHHAAQLAFFKKSLKSLEVVEPHVKKVTERQHIDYHFSGLEEEFLDDADDGDDDDNTFDGHGDGELSFDYSQNDQEEEVSTSRNLMEVDVEDITFSQVEPLQTPKEILDGNYRTSFFFRGEIKNISQSAPLFPEAKFDPAEKMMQMRRPSLTRKFNTYVLPTPDDTKRSKSSESVTLVAPKQDSSLSGRNHSSWHSSPLDPKTYEKRSRGENKLLESDVTNVESIPMDGKNVTKLSRLPPPLTGGILFSRPDLLAVSDSKKLKRHAFSGPISPKPWPTTSVQVEHPQLFSGPILRNPMAHSPPKVSPKVSPSASPTFMSSPKISELHELPRPPAGSYAKSLRPSGLVGHSAPLVPKGHILPATSTSPISSAASSLPTPLQAVTRSFSIPSSGLRAMALNISKPVETDHKQDENEDATSLPLSPMSLSNVQPSSDASEMENQTVQT